MLELYDAAGLRHRAAARATGRAWETVLTRQAFAEAAAEIAAWQGYAPTPLHRLSGLARALGLGDILYKDEAPRFGLGSFKALGGAYAAGRLLQREIARRTGRPVTLAEIRAGAHRREAAEITLVTATDGNHGRSLAWGAGRFGAACRIYIHREVSAHRAEAMEELGAEVIRVEGDYDDSVRIAREEAERNGWFVVSDTSWEGYSEPPRDVMAGYGVMVQEIDEALNEPPSHVLVQGGVGGLAAAVAAGLRQRWGAESPRVVVVEPELAPCLFASAEAGRPAAVAIEEETVMAGLSCGEASPLAWAVLREEASDFLTIPDRLVAPTMRLLARPLEGDPAIVAGESAVAGLAALIAAARDGELRERLGLDGSSVPLVIGTEGATDPEIYRRILAA